MTTTADSTTTTPLSAEDHAWFASEVGRIFQATGDTSRPLDSKPLAIRDAADVADDLMSALTSNHDSFPTGCALILDQAACDLIQQNDPDLVQLGYLMWVEAVLMTPPEVLGQVLHAKAAELRAQLAEGMPRINAVEH